MKKLAILISAVILFSISAIQFSYAQDNTLRKNTGNSNKRVEKKIKPVGSHKRTPVKVDRKAVLEKIKSNTVKIDVKRGSQTWLLEEDFESGIFPPAGWSIDFGATEWQQSFFSANGNGDYGTFYSSWDCNYSDNSIYSPSFSNTLSGDKLIFDYAYAPYDDGFSYYDDLEIFYYDDNDLEWYSLIYIEGEDLQTAMGTTDYYEPQNDEWGTKIIDIPENTTAIYFRVYEDCSNNLYLDNIKVGTVITEPYDASIDFIWPKGKLPLAYGANDKIPVLINNLGTSTIINLKVYLNISGANNLMDSLVIPVLNPLDTMQVDFLGFTPVLNGICDVTVSIPDDDDLGNNVKTSYTDVNSSAIRYVDSNCCNSSVGWVGSYSFLNKYYMSGTGQIRDVNIKIPGGGAEGQIVYGYVINSIGTVAGKSPHYKIQVSDLGNYVTFKITNPMPVTVTNDFYYVGIAQVEYSGTDIAYAPQQFFYETPARPDANYYASLAPVGTNVGAYEFPREYGQNYAIEAVIGDQLLIDNGISDPGLIYDQYFTSTVHTPVVKVFNAGTALSSFNIRRTITPGGYTSTKTVSGLVSGGNANVTFDPWTFTSGTTYTILDTILTFDGNISNNVMSSTITPRIAKHLCILWQNQSDRDSLVRAVNQDGRYANNFDTVRMNYTGAYGPWKIMFVNFSQELTYSPWIRDSLKMFIDNSTAGNKKSLIVFGDAIANANDPLTGFPSPADSVFYRQYLKSMTVSENWVANIPSSQSRFRGIGFFDGISQDSLSDPHIPDLIKPANGSIAAFKPQSVTGNGSDSCIAVCFAGANYNTFFMSNQFSGLRSTGSSPSSPMGPVRVYTKIIDWLQSVNTGAKVMDMTVKLEGFYNPVTNSMVRDTIRVYLRSSVNPFPRVDSAKAFLNSAGQASFVFNNASNGIQYYIHLKHRNGLETWSKTTQSFSSNHLAYNFTTDSAKAFGNNMKKQGSSWVVFTGDVNQDGFIDLTDVVQTYNAAAAFVSGYTNTDVNGDGFSDLTDIVITYNNAAKFIQRSLPLSEPEIIVQNENDQNIFNQISAAQNAEYIIGEMKIDHEIYDKTKNQLTNLKTIPDIKIINKDGNEKIIKGSSIIRENR